MCSELDMYFCTLRWGSLIYFNMLTPSSTYSKTILKRQQHGVAHTPSGHTKAFNTGIPGGQAVWCEEGNNTPTLNQTPIRKWASLNYLHLQSYLNLVLHETAVTTQKAALDTPGSMTVIVQDKEKF